MAPMTISLATKPNSSTMDMSGLMPIGCSTGLSHWPSMLA
jgi:hypothetical protein